MAGGYLYGWDIVNSKSVKLVCDADGKLILDPDSKYTDVKARAAIGNQFDSVGKMLKQLECFHQNLNFVKLIVFKDTVGDLTYSVLFKGYASDTINYYTSKTGTGLVASFMKIHNGTAYEVVAVQPWVDAKYGKTVGTLYWSCPGINFDGIYPQTDVVTKNNYGALVIGADDVSPRCSVFLPHGATVTGAIVNGNVGAEDDTWYLTRELLTTSDKNTMGQGAVNTEDTTISYATIDNSLYAYFIYLTDLANTDEIYGARITYTL